MKPDPKVYGVTIAVVTMLSACGGGGTSPAAPTTSVTPTPSPITSPTPTPIEVAIGNVVVSEFPGATTTEPFARFAFSATGASSFECALDQESFTRCASPLQLPRLNAKSQYERLAVGSHELRVA